MRENTCVSVLQSAHFAVGLMGRTGFVSFLSLPFALFFGLFLLSLCGVERDAAGKELWCVVGTVEARQCPAYWRHGTEDHFGWTLHRTSDEVSRVTPFFRETDPLVFPIWINHWAPHKSFPRCRITGFEGKIYLPPLSLSGFVFWTVRVGFPVFPIFPFLALFLPVYKSAAILW